MIVIDYYAYLLLSSLVQNDSKIVHLDCQLLICSYKQMISSTYALSIVV